MGSILVTFVVITGLLAVLGAPLWIVAWRKNRLESVRNYLFAAIGVGLLCGFIAGASSRNVQQCLDAGNTDCLDSGGPGMHLIFIVLYAIVVWLAAYFMWRDG